MRSFIIIVIIISSFAVFGSERDYQTFRYNGSRGSQSLNLETEVMRTEYYTVRVPYTQNLCRVETYPERQCRMMPGRRLCRNIRYCGRYPNGMPYCQVRPVCRNIPPTTVCQDVPVSRRVCRSVTSYRDERRERRVFDYKVSGVVDFSFSANDFDGNIDMDFHSELIGDNLHSWAEDRSNPRLVLLSHFSEERERDNGDLNIKHDETVQFLAADRLFAPINRQMAYQNIRNGVLNITLGRIDFPANYSFSLEMKGPYGPVFSKLLMPHDYVLTREEEQTNIRMDLKRLLGFQYAYYRGYNLSFNFTLRLDPRNKVLNRAQFSKWDNRISFYNILD